MTESAGMFRFRYIVPFICGGLIVTALLSPLASDGRYGDPRVSSNVAGPLGAQGFFEILAKLGWRTERRVVPGFDYVDSTTVVAVLAPSLELSERETGVLLDRVRAGASLLMVAQNDTPLSDSLRLATDGRLTVAPVVEDVDPGCPKQEPSASLWLLRGRLYVTPFRSWRTTQGDARIFLAVESPHRRGVKIPAAIGFELGRGRIGVVSDAQLFRNDVMRVCRWGASIAAVRMVEYLSGDDVSRRPRVVFDEFHQEFGAQPSIGKAVYATLTQTPPGRTISHAIFAAIVLLAAVAPRAIKPNPTTTIDRRSPFEHVDALATAYQQAGAAQLASERLIHGLRRRVAGPRRAAAPGEEDSHFLDNISAMHPELKHDTDTLKHALAHARTDEALVDVGRAIDHIERTLVK